VNACNQVVCV